MKLIKISIALTILSLYSCSVTPKRSISSINSDELIQQCGTDYLEKIAQIKAGATFTQLNEDKTIATNSNNIAFIEKRSCSVSFQKIEHGEYITHVQKHRDFLLMKTLRGNLYKIKNEKIGKIDLPFPVSSFHISGEVISLYSANDKGRFCTFTELKKGKSLRDNSCSLKKKTIRVE